MPQKPPISIYPSKSIWLGKKLVHKIVYFPAIVGSSVDVLFSEKDVSSWLFADCPESIRKEVTRVLRSL